MTLEDDLRIRDNPCNVNANMIGLQDVINTSSNNITPVISYNGIPIEDVDKIDLSIEDKDYKVRTGFHDSSSIFFKEYNSISTLRKRDEMNTVINPDIDVAIDCIKQIAICNGKCPKKISDGETDDLQCPCMDFIYHGNCSFGLFI